MTIPEKREPTDEGDSRRRHVQQDAGDASVQAGGDITGAIATGENASATYIDHSIHYATLPLLGDGVRTREQAGYLKKLGGFLSTRTHGAAGPFSVEFRGKEDRPMTTPAELVEQCAARGRVVLRGPAGAGKSVLLRRAAQYGLESGVVVPVVLDLSQWKPAHSNAIGKISASKKARRSQFGVILRTSVVRVTQATIDGLLDRSDILLVVDGLNEVGSQATAAAILNAIDAYVEEHPLNLFAVAADRAHHDGTSDLSPWDELEVHPLSRATVKAVLSDHFASASLEAMADDDWALLTSPFFLEQAVSIRKTVLGSAERSLEQFYEQQVGLTDDELARLSQMAFEMYRKGGRTATVPFATRSLTEAAAERLLADGTLTTTDSGEIHFDHQIKHDFLAARYLALHAEEWNSAVFNQITFSASALDVLQSTLTMLSSPSTGDSFLQSIYNWHWLPAVKTAGSIPDGAGTYFSREAEVWLACCAAEKVLDPLIWTSGATRRLLRRLRSPAFVHAADADSADAVVRLSHEIDTSEGWFVEWRNILSLGRNQPAGEERLQLLAGDDPVLGWAASNAAKRWSLDEADLRHLRTIYRSTRDADVRWRVVHTLGAFMSPANSQLLLEALDEPQGEWVRYGAIRSLVEMAIHAGPDAWGGVLEELGRRLGSLTSKLQLKLGEAVFVSDPPPGWTAAVAPLLQEASAQQEALVDADRWRILLRQFERYQHGQSISPPSR